MADSSPVLKPRLSQITLTSGARILPGKNVTMLVGPNNVGKSAILNGIWDYLSKSPGTPAHFKSVVKTISVGNRNSTELIKYLTRKAELVAPGAYPEGTFHESRWVFQGGQAITEDRIHSLAAGDNSFGELAPTFSILIGPEGRGGVLASNQIPDRRNKTQGKNPIQRLWSDRTLEAKISQYMQQAFGTELTVNRHAGINTHLHMGAVTEPEPEIGVKDDVYWNEIDNLPLVYEQGSGIQAFIGTILTIAAGDYDIILLDEPEVFLHPPQARLLGEVVAKMSQGNGPQILVATHSDDFVQGVLNGTATRDEVSIVRITRPSATINKVAQIRPAALNRLISDPLLKYSNILDGVFYKGVVLCESESDCTYYSAVLSHVENSKALSASDCLFTQCGGKDRFSKASSALQEAAVPTAVIADIDLLANRVKLEQLIETLGGSFTEIDEHYDLLKKSIQRKAVRPSRQNVERIFTEITKNSAGQLTNEQIKDLRTALKTESGWEDVKKRGKRSIEEEVIGSFEKIVNHCASFGLFILTVGELESFHSDISGNKQKWLRQVLEQKLYESCSEADALMFKVREYIMSNQ